uniref:Attachment glycoprotein n=1 Tax=Panagrolaimus sp. PS1159 TaxID=55785 RepID=A0AC35GGH7_9BILA
SLSKEKLAELEKQSKNADVKSPNPTLHKTVLPDRSHEEHEKAKQSTSTAEITQLNTAPLTTTPSSSNDTSFSSLQTPPTLSSLTKSESTTSSITSEPITTKSSATATPTTSKSTIDNSVTSVSTSTGSIT